MTKEQLHEILYGGQETPDQQEAGARVIDLYYSGKLPFDRMTAEQLALFMRNDQIQDLLSAEQLDKLYRAKFPFLYEATNG